MLSSFPAAWLVLALPFASAGVIAHTAPLRSLSRSRIAWSIGVAGLCTFAAGLVGLVPEAWTIPAVFLGGVVAGFACFGTQRPDDGGDDWRRWSFPGDDDRPPPGLPDPPTIDWQQFDRLRAQWAGRSRVGR